MELRQVTLDVLDHSHPILIQGYNPIDRKQFSHSNIFMTHIINLCARLEFPEVNGIIYPIDTNKAAKSGISSNAPGVVLVEDFGTVLFHTKTSNKKFGNLWPILTALSEHIIGKDNKGDIIIKGETYRTQIRRLLAEPFRCFYIALGKVTGYNPIC